MSTELVETRKEELRKMSLSSIEEYGSDIQLTISDQMDKMLHDTRCINLEQTGKVLSDLSVESNNITKKLSVVDKLPSMLKVSKWLARYDSIEHRIETLEQGIVEEKARLSTTLNGMYESLQFMREELQALEKCEAELQEMVDFYQTGDNDDDGLKLQAAVNRLKLITTTIAVVKQECAKTVLIIKENKEVTAQLSEAVDNLIPILKITMLNVIGAKTNEEAIKLKKGLAKVANQSIIANAKQIEKTADDLIEGRTKPLIEVKTIQEANAILQSAITKVKDSATVEVQTNLDAIKQLQESISTINNTPLLSIDEEVDK